MGNATFRGTSIRRGERLIADTSLFQGLKEALLFHAVTDMFPLFR